MIKVAKPDIGQEEIDAVKDVLESGNIARGSVVEEFESDFATYVHVDSATATNSGTSAIHTALLAAGVGHGDEVICPAFSFFSSASMVSACGATPVFVDIKLDTYTIDINTIEENITKNTKAIIAVSLYGREIDNINRLYELCKEYNLMLIIDACQSPAPWAAYYCDIACFSFYATKNITTGEGGMVVTNNEDLANEIQLIINHGQEQKYKHTRIGFNYRMTNIAAAIGIWQLEKLSLNTRRRREIAQYYDKNLIDRIIKPEIIDNHIFHQYVIRCFSHEHRYKLKEYLNSHLIETAIHYPIIIPHQPIYRKFYVGKKYPISEKCAATVLSLPCYPQLTDSELFVICDEIKNFFEGK